ncbi:MAG: YbaN family protein [Betaproteobacteria bacterium]|nr:YbaN family protein [Betaproteobacteria bacterium]MCC7216998.1 YbaN family protein [Burkholderiales bacterium]
MKAGDDRDRAGADDDGADVRPHDSPVVRAVLLAAGTLCVALGVIGIFVPVLPTTPFLLLAAACYARASERFYLWLLRNSTFGPTIREWRRHRSIPYRTKVVALALMTTTIAISISLLARYPLAQVALAIVGIVVGAWLYRIPSRDHR